MPGFLSNDRSRLNGAFSVGAMTLATLLAVGCAGLETGNGQDHPPPHTAEVTLALGWGGSLPTDIVDFGGAPITLSVADLTVEELRVDLDASGAPVDCEALATQMDAALDCGKDNRLLVEGPLTASVLDRAWTPSLDRLVMPVGSYKRVRAKIDAAEFAGTVNVGGRTLAFSIAVSSGKTLMFHSPKGVPASDGQPLTLTLGVDLEALFADLDVAACISEQHQRQATEPVVVADAACSNLANKLVNGLDDVTTLD